MSEEINIEPVEQLRSLIEQKETDPVEAYLETLSPMDTARAFSFLNEEERIELIELCTADDAAELLEDLTPEQAADLIEDMTPEAAAVIVEELESDDRVDVLGDVEVDVAEAILDELSDESAAAARILLEYPDDCAGGLMNTEFLSYRENITVAEILQDMREHQEQYADYNIQYVYTTSDDGVFVGVLRLRDIILAGAAVPVKQVMVRDPHFVSVHAPLDELTVFFDEHAFIGVPVVDDEGKLVGVVHRESVEEADAERAAESFRNFSGIIGGEELRSMPLVQRFGRRLPWLSVNILLNMVSASIIAIYTETLEAAIALAVFIPIISDMSGCSGNQSIAVSIRELTMGLASPRDKVRVFLKELSVGLVNGISLGILLCLAAYLWKGNIYLGVVVGGALSLNILMSVCVGGLIPLFLKQFNQDPALASSPILTTLTDMFGFFLVLSFATACLSQLTL